MKLLLDTVTFIWLTENDSSLSQLARNLIYSPFNELYLSSASVWEIAIKHNLGRLDLKFLPEEYVSGQRQLYYIESVPIREIDALQAGRLPHIHRDPFDRIIIAQAIVEDLIIVTPDRMIVQYQVPVLW